MLFSKVFNWVSVRTVSEYNNIGGNNKDGVLYDVVNAIEISYKNDKNWNKGWVRYVSLKFDAWHIAEKNVINL